MTKHLIINVVVFNISLTVMTYAIVHDISYPASVVLKEYKALSILGEVAKWFSLFIYCRDYTQNYTEHDSDSGKKPATFFGHLAATPL